MLFGFDIGTIGGVLELEPFKQYAILATQYCILILMCPVITD